MSDCWMENFISILELPKRRPPTDYRCTGPWATRGPWCVQTMTLSPVLTLVSFLLESSANSRHPLCFASVVSRTSAAAQCSPRLIPPETANGHSVSLVRLGQAKEHWSSKSSFCISENWSWILLSPTDRCVCDFEQLTSLYLWFIVVPNS